MNVDSLSFPAAQVAVEADQARLPVAFVDLAREEGSAESIRLPACPVIALGDRAHPLAGCFDAVAEPGFAATDLLKAAASQPLAAAVTAQLLRLLPALDDDGALTAESLAYATLQASQAHRTWIGANAAREHDLSAPGQVRLEREDSHMTITLDRVAAGNAIDRPMRDGLHEAFALANLDDTISRITLRGAGKAFSLGADLSEFGTTGDPAEAHRIRCLTLPAREAVRCGDRLEVEIDGACIGAGLEISAYARRIVATPRSWFQLPELAMGVLPGAGGCVSLSRRIGRRRALLMILSGRRLSARKALDWGLVDALVDDIA